MFIQNRINCFSMFYASRSLDVLANKLVFCILFPHSFVSRRFNFPGDSIQLVYDPTKSKHNKKKKMWHFKPCKCQTSDKFSSPLNTDAEHTHTHIHSLRSKSKAYLPKFLQPFAILWMFPNFPYSFWYFSADTSAFFSTIIKWCESLTLPLTCSLKRKSSVGYSIWNLSFIILMIILRNLGFSKEKTLKCADLYQASAEMFFFYIYECFKTVCHKIWLKLAIYKHNFCFQM